MYFFRKSRYEKCTFFSKVAIKNVVDVFNILIVCEISMHIWNKILYACG